MGTSAATVGEHEVIVVGGGPTGMMAAAELALGGVDVVVVERRPDQAVDGSRAGGLHARTLEVLDQRGVVDRFVEAGQIMQVAGFAGTSLDLGDFPTRHPHGLALWQSAFEPILAEWVAELGVPTLRQRDAVALAQGDAGVDVELSDGARLHGAYLVGCDGGRSFVRRAAGIDFPGLDASTSWMIAQVEMGEEPRFGFHRDELGQHAIGRRQPDEPIAVVLTEPDVDHDGDPSVDDLRTLLVRIYGTDFDLRGVRWISRFTDASRHAATYRSGRVLVAGDAAHVHPPQGGQGLNIGVQDAVNLGWKLAQVVRGTSPPSLLDTYHAERHPIAARVLHTTMAQVAAVTPGPRHDALRSIIADLVAYDEPRRYLAGMMSGLDVAYESPEGLEGDHPLVGRRMPDLDLDLGGTGVDGPTRAFALLHAARPVVLDLGGPGRGVLAEAAAGWAERAELVEATTEGPWELPVIGAVPAPAAVAVRPDGYVAWVGELDDPSFADAMSTWFGPPSTRSATSTNSVTA